VRARKPTRQENDAAELLPVVDAADRITRFFDELGADKTASVTIYAIDPANRLRRSFLFTMPDARELNGPDLMAQVLERHGAGEYIAESRDVDTGQIIFNPRFEVGGFVHRGRGVIPGPVAAVAPAKPGDTSSELAAAINRQSALLEAVLANQAQQPSTLDRLREFKELREVFAPAAAAAPGLDFAKVLELVTGVLDLREKLGDAGGGGSGPLEVLARSLAPALTKIAERAIESPALPAPPLNGVTVTAPAAPGGVDVAGTNNVMLRVYVGELVRFAEQGLDPEAAAACVLQTLSGFPEPMQAAVVDWLNDERVVENLTTFEPKAANYAQWLSAVVDRVLDALLEPDDDADDEPDETETPAPPANGGTQPAAG